MSPLYQTQRAMRALRRAALTRGTIALLDVGTSKVACLLLRFDAAEGAQAEGVGRMAGQTAFRVIGHATTRSRGVRFGEVDSMGEVERAIRTVVQQAQKSAGMRVDHVIACLSGARPQSWGLSGQSEVEGPSVTDGDIGRVLASCEMPVEPPPMSMQAAPSSCSSSTSAASPAA